MQAQLVDVAKIWDQAPHNAFTSLTRFDNHWYCAFREGVTHISLDGKLRVLNSVDGREWKSVALLESPSEKHPDMRDAKIGVTPDGRLMVIGAGAFRGDYFEHQSYIWFSNDGAAWSEPTPIGDFDFWMWNFAWEGETLYSVAHAEILGSTEGQGVRLYQSKDAKHYEPIATIRKDFQFPNETAIIMHEGQGVALMRREWAEDQAPPPPWAQGNDLLGVSSAPYTDWTWHDIGFHIGGPALIRLPDGRFIAGGRKMHPQNHTSLWHVDISLAKITFKELITLPSANDSSYPGFVWYEDMLWVSYFSAHEGKSSIYLAKLKII